MLSMLETLANDIAALREAGQHSGNAQTGLIANLMAARLTLMLDERAEREGALSGEMPWLKEFRAKPA